MAKAELNQALHTLSGKLDGWVYRKVRGRTIVVRQAEPSDKPPSPAQLESRDRFTAAQAYMKTVLADPCQREVYEALAKTLNRRADKIVAGDFLNPPVVERIDMSGYRGQPGGLIRVIATDDVEVVSVDVSVQGTSGAVIDQGACAKVHGVWRYIATAAIPGGERATIIAVAKDRPGHEGRAEVVYP